MSDVVYIQYVKQVDQNERNHRAEPEMVDRDFWGQLLKMFVINLNNDQAKLLGQSTARPVALAIIRRVDAKKNQHGIISYKHEQQLDVVDLNSIQCVVGRVHYMGQWIIIDRSDQQIRPSFRDHE
jgi:hypothetical protein